ncbi:MAG TPA: DUF3662 and FHA domain-containing protein [Solirubrobacteraceae bacterium]|nr:DUF3662 and FHA domain-containing protein [Solirubrobacteraceae bacterium]
MSVLRNLEDKIAGLVEGAFGRAFRSEIRPVELARRLAREMDRHRRPSLSSTYVPNEYVVWLSPADRRALAPIEEGLVEELAAYLLEHARAERLALVSHPRVELRTDARLALGECGIEANLVGREPPQGEIVARRGEGSRAGQAYLAIDGARTPIAARGLVIGRSPDADVVLSSTDVSRRHAEIVPDAGGWVLVDLDSTNGVRLNGRSVGVPTLLTDGDVIEIGPNELLFEVH